MLTSLTVECSEVLSSDVVEFLEEIFGVGDVLVLGVSFFDDVSVLSGHRSVNLNVSFAEVLDADGV